MGRSEWNKKNRDSAKGLLLTPLLGKSWPLGVLTEGVLAAGPWSSGLGTLLTTSLAIPAHCCAPGRNTQGLTLHTIAPVFPARLRAVWTWTGGAPWGAGGCEEAGHSQGHKADSTASGEDSSHRTWGQGWGCHVPTSLSPGWQAQGRCGPFWWGWCFSHSDVPSWEGGSARAPPAFPPESLCS